MSGKTALSVLGTPGPIHAFLPKTPSDGGKGIGTFTALSVIALPGAIHSFTAKTPEGAGVHEGQFTALSVIALPGGKHVFLPKEFVEPTPPVIHYGGGGLVAQRWKQAEFERKFELKEKILRDDREILELLSMITPFL